jgi:septation ring formation regulator EzrA
MSMTFEQLQIIAEQAFILSEKNTQSISRLEDSLTRLESSLVETKAIADSNARAIQATANKLDEKFDQIANAVIRGQDRLERLERRDRRVDKEIRGLRIETRRILERWLGEPFPDDPDLDDEDEPD